MNNSILEQIDEAPLIAILRGITPEEAEPVSDILFAAGFRFLEVTLNSPDWEESLRRINRRHGDAILLGAGTVLTAKDVDKVRDAGGKAVISPNMNPAVIRKSREQGLLALPGCFTPSECFTALDAGADALKLFPADCLGPAFLRAMKAVLPEGTRLCPTGGITPETLDSFREAGAWAAGTGSSLYRPGKSLEEIGKMAKAFSEAAGFAQPAG